MGTSKNGPISQESPPTLGWGPRLGKELRHPRGAQSRHMRSSAILRRTQDALEGVQFPPSPRVPACSPGGAGGGSWEQMVRASLLTPPHDPGHNHRRCPGSRAIAAILTPVDLGAHCSKSGVTTYDIDVASDCSRALRKKKPVGKLLASRIFGVILRQ